VLEHVGNPGAALVELGRVLRPGGTLVLTVPHLSRRHELPHDYYRYTQEGVTHLLGQHGFEVIESGGYGGLLSFLHHQASFFFPGLVAGLPILGTIASAANFPISWLVVQLDRLTDPSGLLATGVWAVGRRASVNTSPSH
jgi:SAM-dependent methyltransferase